MSAAAEQPHPIIIVKRHGGHDDEGHHGGVWKIAFADFMTAMMCFFLVMWLINAANEQTKAAVASYFNPVKLVDRNSSSKGLQDVSSNPGSSGSASGEAQSQSEEEAATPAKAVAGEVSEASAEKAKDTKTPDEKLFANPYAVLAEIAAQTDVMQNMSEKGEGGASLAGPDTGASGGDSYRDPFAPDFWSQQVAATETTSRGSPKVAPPEDSSARPAAAPGKAVAEVAAAGEKPATGKAAAKADGAAETADTAEAAAAEAAQPAAPPPAVAKKARPKPAGQAADGAEAANAAEASTPKPSQKAIEAAREIKAALTAAFGPGEKIAEGLSVVADEKGVRISLTDQLDFGMFEIGSALPRRDMVLAMEKIGRIIEGRPGEVTISGHTDGRPFRNAAYDNWRLSTARAQSAYYMLVRAGLDEKRVTEVSGFADRKLKDRERPLAAGNRRIEIELRVEG